MTGRRESCLSMGNTFTLEEENEVIQHSQLRPGFHSCQMSFRRLIVEAGNPGASSPRRAARASVKSLVEIPFK
jgi:hypothetical protein